MREAGNAGGARRLGPLHMTVLAFDGNRFDGSILAELKQLREAGTIRLIGLLFIRRGPSGAVTAIQKTDLAEHEMHAFGELAGDLIGLGDGALGAALVGAQPGPEARHGFSEHDIRKIAQDLPRESAAALVLIEHSWALRLKERVVAAGGAVVADGLVGPTELVALHDLLADAPGHMHLH